MSPTNKPAWYRSDTAKRWGVILALAAVYFVAGKLGLQLAFAHPSATPVWPPTGLTLAAFLLLGYRGWPGIFLGAFLVHLTTAGSLATSVALGAGNTLEGVVGAYLVLRFANGARAFERAQDVFKFAFLAAMVSTTVSATIGVTSLAFGGFAPWSQYGAIWLTWWLGDAGGDLVVAPLVLLWAAPPAGRLDWFRVLETALMLLAIVVVGQIVFDPLNTTGIKNYPLEFLFFPVLIWAAFRLGPRQASLALALLAALSIPGTLAGFGPFAAGTPNEALLLLQAFTGVSAVMTLALAAVVAERKRAEELLRQLAVTDALTGLANYRHLMEELELEIRRSERTGRPFAILMLDLDGLKQINDLHGHLVGSRAIVRLADVLRQNSRAIDTAARYGGDEFVVVLVETDEAPAREVARRIAEQAARDAERPPISVSVGVAVYHFSGGTVEQLIAAADASLYQSKSRNHTPAPRQP